MTARRARQLRRPKPRNPVPEPAKDPDKAPDSFPRPE